VWLHEVIVRVLVRTVAILFAATFVGAAHAAAGSPREFDESFSSHALTGRLHFEVFLPSEYGLTRRRYPVIYVLHGLPATVSSYRSDSTWVADALQAAHREAIVVAPQGARDRDTDPEYHNWGPGRNWETALTKELPAVVDARFRTMRARSGRALIGFSAGGYGASVLGLHHLDEFAVVESWSGYFHATDPTGHHTLDVGSKEENAYASVHTIVSELRSAFRAHPTFFAFYVGDQDFFAPENVRLHHELTRARVRHTFRVYRGGHQTSLWKAEASRWLGLALDHMAN
jgi:S-formylglutathione hydrolase FrmB